MRVRSLFRSAVTVQLKSLDRYVIMHVPSLASFFIHCRKLRPCPPSTRIRTFFKSHLFSPEVHDSHHNRFEPLLYERSVGVREAFVFMGHKGDFYLKSTPTLFYKCSVIKKHSHLSFKFMWTDWYTALRHRLPVAHFCRTSAYGHFSNTEISLSATFTLPKM